MQSWIHLVSKSLILLLLTSCATTRGPDLRYIGKEDVLSTTFDEFNPAGEKEWGVYTGPWVERAEWVIYGYSYLNSQVILARGEELLNPVPVYHPHGIKWGFGGKLFFPPGDWNLQIDTYSKKGRQSYSKVIRVRMTTF